MKIFYDKKYRIPACFFLLLLLCANLLYWGSRKEGFFCDELYSYHFTHNVSNPYLVEEQEGETWLNNWHSSAFFRDYLTLDSEERFDISGVWNAIEADVHPPLFYLFLELSSSVFSTVFPGIFTKWSGIFVNIAFFILTIFFLWKLSKELTESDFWSAAVCMLYGFSAGAVSTVVFIRMYMVFTCLAVLFTLLNALLWKSLWNEEGKGKKWLFPALSVTTILGILTQYYFLIYAFLICVVIWVCAMLKRRWAFMLQYTGAMAAGLAGSCLIWPDMLVDIFDGYRGAEAFANLAAGGSVTEAFAEFLDILNGELFGKGAVLLLVFVLLLLAGRFLSSWWRMEKYMDKDNSVHILFRKKTPPQKLELRFTVQDFIWVHVLFAVVFYIIFMSKIAPYREDRYIFPVFPLIVLLAASLIGKLVSGMPGQISAAAVMLLSACMLAGYLFPGIHYLYQGTGNKLETVSLYSNLPTFYVTSGSSYRACGESVYFSMAECTYPVSGGEIHTIPEALAGLAEEENIRADIADENITRCLFYIDLIYEDRELLVQQIAQLFPGEEMRFLFDTEYSAVYILE
ncbi:MAG: glycosyltransferase family 39 protein [Lachnospiraceae bacterium]|nr:glycosyltransferase family 39 protein [Lachnospiraceae bacterium]